MITTVDTFFRW